MVAKKNVVIAIKDHNAGQIRVHVGQGRDRWDKLVWVVQATYVQPHWKGGVLLAGAVAAEVLAPCGRYTEKKLRELAAAPATKEIGAALIVKIAAMQNPEECNTYPNVH